MTGDHQLRVLDITRTVSRMGKGHATGVDRVEQAYIRYLIDSDSNAFFLARIRKQYAILDKVATQKLLNNLNAPNQWGRRYITDILRRRLSREQQKGQSYIRRLAHKIVTEDELVSAFHDQSVEYINTGHSNITNTLFGELKSIPNCKIRVLIHDLIPLDYPEYTRLGITKRFAQKMQIVSKYADEVICNSEYTKSRVDAVFPSFGRTPRSRVAWLGVEPSDLQRTPSVQPSFIMLGTIEPRKNHQLILDVWTEFHRTLPIDQIPHLHIIGKRGWENQQVFDQLDTASFMNDTVFEHSDLKDDDMQMMLSKATAMLFPSYVEGFGLPALEAVQAGLPLFCSNIPAFHEIVQDMATFLPVNDSGRWVSEIKRWAELPQEKLYVENRIEKPHYIPTWESHFGHVFGS